MTHLWEDHVLIAEARSWLADCAWVNMTEDDFSELTESQVVAGVQRHYEGGWAAFVAATV